MLIIFQLVMLGISLLFCLVGATVGYLFGEAQTGAVVGLGLGIIPGFILAAKLEDRPAARRREQQARLLAGRWMSRPSKRKRRR